MKKLSTSHRFLSALYLAFWRDGSYIALILFFAGPALWPSDTRVFGVWMISAILLALLMTRTLQEMINPKAKSPEDMTTTWLVLKYVPIYVIAITLLWLVLNRHYLVAELPWLAPLWIGSVILLLLRPRHPR